MKKLISFVLSIVFILTIFAACTKTNEPSESTADLPVESVAATEEVVLTGSAEGKHGTIEVAVTVKDQTVTNIEVTKQMEHETLGAAAFEGVTAAVLATNSTNVDTISGATETSAGFIEAINNALASGNIELIPTGESASAVEEAVQTYDVVVIGAGGAGMAAAIEVKEAGASVVIIEKTGVVGGNTALSGSYNGAGTRFQEALGIEDSADVLFDDVMKGGDNLSDPDLVRVFADGATETVHWTVDHLGVELDESYLGQFDVASFPRAHSTTQGTNAMLVKALKDKCDELGVEFKFTTSAKEFIVEDEKVVGVKAENASNQEITFNANNGIVLATGGFAANFDMVAEYDTEGKVYIITTNAPSITGDGIKMAEAIGANLIGMEHIQTNPSGNPKTGDLMLFAGYGKLDGGFVVNKEGKRFVNDADRRDVQCAAYLEQTDGIVYYVWGNEVDQKRNNFGINEDLYEQEAATGALIKADTLKECADFFGVDYDVLEETRKHYNEMVEAGEDTDFGRTSNLTITEEGPFYMASVTPSVHHTMGGIEINTEAQVIDKDGNVIENLFAAGEVTGGLHGGNRLGGNAVTDAMLFGRIAGKNVVSGVSTDTGTPDEAASEEALEPAA